MSRKPGLNTDVAQLVEHRSPKPSVAGSIPAVRVIAKLQSEVRNWKLRARSAVENQKKRLFGDLFDFQASLFSPDFPYLTSDLFCVGEASYGHR